MSDIKNQFNFNTLHERNILKTRKSLEVIVGKIKIGGKNPIVIQSMTSGSRKDPSDVKAIARDELLEIKELFNAGSEIVRIALNSEKTAESIPYIKEDLLHSGIDVPLVGCGQYEIADLITKFPSQISMLEKLRINPGNIGFGSKRDTKFESVIEFACKYNIPVRIGVNWGSLDKALTQEIMDDNSKQNHPMSSNEILRKALVLSALISAKRAESIGLPENKMVISCKVSRVQDLIAIYRFLHFNSNYALHLGLTEAGMGRKAAVSTAAGIGILLNEGIGDTIRASLTPKVDESRTNEVVLCKEILQSLGIRSFVPQLTSCPGCGRTSGNYFQQLSEDIQKYIDDNISAWKKSYPGIENLKIAVMGCVVNGPGESKHADIGISLPGYGENSVAAVFIDGRVYKKLSGDNIYQEFIEILINYIKNKYTL